MDFAARAREKFARAGTEIDADLNTVFADHAAKGLLRSGTTIIASVQAFEDRTGSAMRDIQQQFAAVVQNRSSEWRKAMQALDAALGEQIENAPQILVKAIRVANGDVGPGPLPTEGRAIRGFNALIQAAAARLTEEQRAFQDGWTSPPGRSWIERHPVQYGFAAAVGGAILTKGADLLYAVISRTPG